MKKNIFITLAFALLSLGLRAQVCKCPENLAYVMEKVETNYAGFHDKVTHPEKSAYKKLKKKANRLARKALTYEKCADVISGWLATFHDAHVFLSLSGKAAGKLAIPATEKFPGIQRLDEQTTLLVLPSFELKYTKAIDSLVALFNAYPTLQLIIDIRGNGGGGDRAYAALLPLLYTRPYEVHGVEFFASEDNVAKFEALLEEDIPADTRKVVEELVTKLKAAPGQFVPWGKEISTRTYSFIQDAPARVGVIQDGKCASATEQFLLYALQSDKVTTFGAGNTKGALDYANVNMFPLPGMPYAVGVPSSRSTRLPELPVDKEGIAPQVNLPVGKDDVVSYVRNNLSSELQHP